MIAITDKNMNWDLEDAMEFCANSFSGKLLIRSSLGYSWVFHFFLGRIVSESGGVHTSRRWQRLLSDVPQQKELHPIELKEFQQNSSSYLERMVKRSQITRDQALNFAKQSILNSLFDVLQLEQLCRQSVQSKIFFEVVPDANTKKGSMPWIFFRSQEMYKAAQMEFFLWQQQKLGKYSPNLAPVLKGLIPLSATILEKQLLNLVDGDRSIRDLAMFLHQEPIQVFQTLLPFIDQGFVILKATNDIASSNTAHNPSPVDTTVISKPMIAYVDDNPIEGKIMGEILQKIECDFIHIHDPLKAMTILLKNRPSLIFLDLVMPIVNGYELCSQLRRVTVFAETPIVILTGNDGIIDRLRATMVGCTEFLSKPIEKQKILQTLNKHNVIPSMSSNNAQLSKLTHI